MKLSVIIPVFNVEQYVEKCVKSVLEQTFSNLEILLIDDGSTDKSGEICDRLELLDDRIKVFHKKNGGLSDARNFGLEKSTGDYVTFLDSDDFIKNDAYEQLLSLTAKSKVDIIIGGLLKYYPSNNRLEEKKLNKSTNSGVVFTGKDYLLDSVKEKYYTAVAVKGIYRKSLIIDNKLYFKKGILHEDELWSPQVLVHAKSVIESNYFFYMHVHRDGSITNNSDKSKNAKDLIKIAYELEEFYNSQFDDEHNKFLRDYLVMLYLNAVYIGRLDMKSKNFEIDYDFLKRNAYSIKNILKIILIRVNKKLYIKINDFIKTL